MKILGNDELEKSVCVVVGTRPSIIKMCPIIKEFGRRKANHFVIHAGQHYSYNMDRKFFKDLELPQPKYKLKNMGRFKRHGQQTAEMIKGIEEILIREKPQVVLVCADANFNLAGALAARKLGLKLGHVEAGLRSNDWRMPEEHNRVMIDHISDFLFVPTEEARRNAVEDNVKGAIVLCGNTIVDSLNENLEVAKRKSKIMEDLGIESKSFFVLTLHREENVDVKVNLEKIIRGLEKVTEKFDYKIIFPIHPRTVKMLKVFDLYEKLKNNRRIRIIDPIGYLDFLLLLSNAKLVLTDSGGVQEESCILGIPCVTLRTTTERPETTQIGSNIVAGLDGYKILDSVERMLKAETEWGNPFGDGKAGKRIVDFVLKGVKNGFDFGSPGDIA